MKLPFSPTIYRLLRKSERYTKTDMVYLAKGGTWLMIGQFIASLSSLILAVTLANLLNPEVYGSYKYVLSIIGLLALATLPGLDTSCVQAVARGLEGTFLSLQKRKLWSSGFGTLAGLGVSLYFWSQGSPMLATSLALASLLVPVTDGLTLHLAYLNGKKDFYRVTLYQSTTRIIQTAVIIGTALWTQSLVATILSTLLSLGFVRILMTYRVQSLISSNSASDLQAFSYGLHLTSSSFITVIADQLDKLIIFALMGPVDLAVYTIAVAPPDQIKTIVKQLQQIAFPRFAEHDMTIIRATLLRKLLLLTAALAGITALYIASAPFLFSLILPRYGESVLYSQVFALSLMTLPLLIILSLFQAKKMTKEIYQHQTITSIAQIIFTGAGIWCFGLWGAIAARMLYRISSLLFAIILFGRIKA